MSSAEPLRIVLRVIALACDDPDAAALAQIALNEDVDQMLEALSRTCWLEDLPEGGDVTEHIGAALHASTLMPIT